MGSCGHSILCSDPVYPWRVFSPVLNAEPTAHWSCSAAYSHPPVRLFFQSPHSSLHEYRKLRSLTGKGFLLAERLEAVFSLQTYNHIAPFSIEKGAMLFFVCYAL